MSFFKPYSCIFLLAMALFLCSIAKAQSPQNPPGRYYVEHFGEEEGLPQNSINSILPDNNDFLWIATEGGITRFNGNRFLNVPFAPGITGNNFTRIKSFYFKGKDTIIAFSGANNRVGIILNNKIVAVEGMQYNKYGIPFLNRFNTVPAPGYIADPGSNTSDVLRDWDIQNGGYYGALYNKDTFLVVLNSGIGIYDSKGKISEIKIDDIDFSKALFLKGKIIYLDDKNYINFYSLSGFEKRELLPIPAKHTLKILNNDFENSFFCVADSVLYLVSIASDKINVQEILTNLQHAEDITTVYQKGSNMIVTGTIRNGLYVYKKQYFQTSDPLPNGESDAFYSQTLFPDNQTILTGTDRLFRNGHYIGKTKSDFLTNIYSTLKDSKGNYWYVFNDRILRAREIGVAPDTMIYFTGIPSILFEDKDERIWIFSGEQFGYYANGKFTTLKFDNLNSASISYMCQDIEGRYMIGTRDGLFILKDVQETVLKEIPGFRSLDVRYILPEANKQAWVCTYGQGFYLITKEGVTAFPQNNGKLAYVHYIFEDAKGYFWIPTNNGLFVTSRESLMAYTRNRNEIPFYFQFSKKHGLRTNEFNGGAHPAFLRLPNGDVNLASMQGLVRFNPGAINFNFSSSPILVDNIWADSTEILQRDEFDIKNNTGNVSFSLSSSFWGEKENDLLEYQLIEKGKSPGAWLQVDESGKINLFTPSHGNYQLLVRKRKGLKADDYLYKEINFRVLPKWYQTKAFYLAALIGIILILTGIFFWRRNYYRRANRILQGKVNVATIELLRMNNTLEKKVEERTHAIQQAEIRFRTLVEGSLVGVYIVQNNEFIYVNPRFEEILGYDKDELLGISPVLIISEDQRKAASERITLRMSGKVKNENYEISGVKKDGSLCQLEFFGSTTTYEGKTTIIGTMVDITERKKMEVELREAEMKFRDLVEKSLVGVYIICKRRFVYVNPRFAEIFGRDQQELIDAPSVDIVVYEPDMKIVAENIKQRITGKADGIRYEVRGIKKDGTIINIEMFGRTTQFEGEPAIIGTLLDITARKIAEDQLIKEKDLSQSIINSLPGVFYVFDQNGKYQLWNKNHETVTGYNAEEMSRMHPDKFIEESQLEVLHKRMEKVFTEGHAELEANFLRKDGTGVPYYFNGILINYNDKPCIMGVGIDISEQKRAEDQLIIEKDLSQSIINSLPGVFFIFNQSRTHLLWNKNYEAITGYSPEELKEKLAGTCVEEKDLELFSQAVKKMYATGNAALEVTMITKEKKKIPFYVNGIAITYDGKPCILGIGIDISERKKAEGEREHANYLLNERIKELTTLYRAGLVLQREEKSILVTLQDFVSMLPAGWQYPDITAACIKLGEMEFITPNFKPSQFSQSASFGTPEGTIGKIEVVYLEERPAEDEGPFLLEERKLIDMLADMLRIYFTRREAINALQKSEANLQTIFDTTDTVYVLLNINSQVIAFNQRAAAFSEKEFKKTLRQNTVFLDYFPEDRRPIVSGNLIKVMAGKHISYEYSYPQPDDSLNWYHIRMYPITNSEKTVLGMMMAVSDITEKKLMEQEILNQKVQEQKKVIRAILIGEERERNKIGQELHDNVNQILAGTKLYLGLARKVKEGGENIINESMELIDSAIEEIRILSRGKVTPMKKVNLQELVQNLVDNLAVNSKIKTSFVYNGSGQQISDDLKLNTYRIIQEQMSNILKHANAKNVRIMIEAGIQNIRVMVSDDGKGFEVDAKKKGIGISNMVNRVESFNGTITMKSSPGKGCTIDINIPF